MQDTTWNTKPVVYYTLAYMSKCKKMLLVHSFYGQRRIAFHIKVN